MTEFSDEIHPDEILQEEFMKPMGVTARQLAADTALRLGLYFGIEPRFWMNLQSEHDMCIAIRELHDKIAPRIRVLHVVAT